MEPNPNYKYPKGDFLSGFSESDAEPCDYELECQRMVVRGASFLDANQDIYDFILNDKPDVFHDKLKPLIDYMLHPESGQTGAMVSHCVKHSFFAKKLGWDKYIEDITKPDEE